MKGYLFAGILAALMIGAIGGYFKGRADSDMSAEVREKQGVIDRQSFALKQANEAKAAFEAKQGALSAQVSTITRNLNNARTENERLRSLITAGDIGVYVDAVCEPPAAADGGDPGRGDGGRCRLTRRGEQNYVDLLDKIDGKQAALDKCRATLLIERGIEPPG